MKMSQNMEALKEQLMERRTELIDEMHFGARQLGDYAADPIKADPADWAQDMSEQEQGHTLVEMRWREIQQIEKALEKMGEGIYDRCEKCGGKIPIARLKVIPSATLCVNCQEKVEQGRAWGETKPMAPVLGSALDSGFAKME